jgi:hypothetical protein
MRVRRVGATMLLAAVLGPSLVDAAALCKKKNGVVVIRDATCKAKEQPVDLSAFGAIGPKGDAGAPGAKGDKGDQGNVGPVGPLVATLPSGATLRGSFGFGAVIASGESVQGSISFPYHLTASPTPIIVPPLTPTPVGCTGDVGNPGAAAGNFCIFTAFVVGDCTGPSSYGAVDGLTDYRYGGVPYLTANTSGVCEASGTWAVTAP